MSSLVNDLFYSARCGDEEIFSILAQDQSLIYSKDDNGNTIIHYMAANNHVELLKNLMASDLMRNISVLDEKNLSGNTPLHWAALNNCLEVAKLLVENKVKIGELNDFEESPLDVCTKANSNETLEYLVTIVNSKTFGHPDNV